MQLAVLTARSLGERDALSRVEVDRFVEELAQAFQLIGLEHGARVHSDELRGSWGCGRTSHQAAMVCWISWLSPPDRHRDSRSPASASSTEYGRSPPVHAGSHIKGRWMLALELYSSHSSGGLSMARAKSSRRQRFWSGVSTRGAGGMAGGTRDRCLPCRVFYEATAWSIRFSSKEHDILFEKVR